MSVTIRFAGDVNDLLGKQDTVRKGTEQITDEWKQWLKQTKELDQSARKVLRDIETDQERYNAKLRELNTLYKAGRINAEQFQRAVKQAQTEMNGTIDKGQQGLGSYIGKIGLTAAAIETVRQSWQKVMEIQQQAIDLDRRYERKTRAATEGIANFVSMQPAGTEKARLKTVMELARGVMGIGEAADMFQSIQSAAPGTDRQQFAAAKAAAKEVFQAAKLGMPADLGGELATQAFNVGMAPDQMVRAGFAAGIASKRGPREVAAAAPAIGLFDDPRLGVAVAAQMAGVDKGEVKSLTGAAARTLAGAPGQGPSDWFIEQGLPQNASMAQRLQMLQKQGIDTVAEMSAIGINDSLQQRAIGALTRAQDIQSLGTITQAIDAAIANPNYLATIQKKNEQAIPEMKFARLTKEQESMATELQSFSVGAQSRVLKERKLQVQLLQNDLETTMLGYPIFDEDGNMDYGRFNRTKLWDGGARARIEAQVDAEQSTLWKEMLRNEARQALAEQKRKTPAIQKQEK